MNEENQKKGCVLRLIKKLDFFSSVKSFVWLVIIYLFIIPLLVGATIFILYIATHSFPYQEPETLAFKLTLVIFFAMELSFFLGYLVIKSRKNIENELKIESETIDGLSKLINKVLSMPTLAINFFKMIFPIIVAVFSSKICYEVYAFLIINPPPSNPVFGAIIFLVMVFSFFLTCLLWALAYFLKKKFN
jgi:hypothetical protein